jgi:hypothetical protein
VEGEHRIPRRQIAARAAHVHGLALDERARGDVRNLEQLPGLDRRFPDHTVQLRIHVLEAQHASEAAGHLFEEDTRRVVGLGHAEIEERRTDHRRAIANLRVADQDQVAAAFRLLRRGVAKDVLVVPDRVAG